MTDTTHHDTGHEGGAHEGADGTRRDFIHIAAAAAGAVGVGAVVWPLIHQMNPAADTLALASTEYDLSQVAEGQQVVITWRKKPVFVRHLTAAEIASAKADDPQAPSFRDPQTFAERIAQANGDAGKENYLILEANCTHLGCVPTFAEGDWGGWKCACHGSVFDTAGRIRKGPAPLNLPVPPYVYVSDAVVKIG